MKTLTLMLSMVFAFAAFADARPLTVGTPDGSGNVTITIGGTGTQNQTLIAAWAARDMGDDPLAWTEYADAGTVAPGDTSKTFQIPAAWRAKSGAVRFFLMSGPKPYAKRFDYVTRPEVEKDKDTWINTAIYPDSSLDICVKFRSDYMSGNPSMCPFGFTRSASAAVFIFPANASEYWFDFFGAKATTTDNKLGTSNKNVLNENPPHDTQPHEFRMNRTGIYIDGYRHLAFDQATITMGKSEQDPIALFGRYGGWKQEDTSCSIYYAIISTNGVPAREYVPCQKTDGTVTLYDRVTKTFANIGGNLEGRHLDAGTDIGPYPSDCGSVESVSAAVNLAPAIVVSSPDFSANTVDVTLSSGHDAGLLFAVAGAEDEGMVFSDWTTNAFVQKVAVGVDAVTFSLPEEWIRNHYNIRFAWKSMAGLPYDYEVAYLHSDADSKQRIRTGWTPTTNTTIHVNAKTAYNTCSFGIIGGYYLFLNGNGSGSKIYWGFFSKAEDGSNLTGSIGGARSVEFVDAYHDWRLGPGGVSVDDEVSAISGFAPKASVTTDMLIPFRAPATDDSSYVQLENSKLGDVSVRFAKIWEGDEIVRDYVPSVKDGLPGFYDRVRKTFVRSVTATSFVAGAPVVADGDILSWSEVRSLRAGFSILFR